MTYINAKRKKAILEEANTLLVNCLLITGAMLVSFLLGAGADVLFSSRFAFVFALATGLLATINIYYTDERHSPSSSSWQGACLGVLALVMLSLLAQFFLPPALAVFTGPVWVFAALVFGLSVGTWQVFAYVSVILIRKFFP